jgi:hypothetical protein
LKKLFPKQAYNILEKFIYSELIQEMVLMLVFCIEASTKNLPDCLFDNVIT